MRNNIQNKIKTSPANQVDLGKLDIKDNELEEIVKMIVETKPNISEIFLNDNLITDIGAKIIAKQFATLNQLSVLDLQFNQIGKEGALSLFSLRSKNLAIKIPFHGNKITNVIEMDEIVKRATHHI